jgi:Tfp pilus assembly protein PilO
VSRRTVVIGAIAALVIVALWWFLVYSPAGDDLTAARDDVESAEREQQGLQAQLAQLEDIAANGPAIDAELARLTDLVPSSPDLAGFILGANDLAIESGIDWLSVAPSPPAASGPGFSTISVAMQLEGGFFQVLDYLNRLEDFDRLVVVDSVQLNPGGSEDGTDGAPSVVGATRLSVSLNGRMFTTQIPVAPGTATTTTTTTVAGATTTTGAGSTTTQAVQ